MIVNLAVTRALRVALTIVAIGTATAAYADPNNSQTKRQSDTRFYAGLTIASMSLGGDFDGKSALISTSGTDVIFIPEIDDAMATGIRFGFGTTRQSLEISYLVSSHDATLYYGSVDTTADLAVVNLDGRFAFAVRGKSRPYALIGLSIPELVVKDSAVGSLGQVGDAKYSGIGINLGAGWGYQAHRNISVDANLTLRYFDFTSVDGVGVSGSLEDNLGSSSLSLGAGLNVHF